MGCSLDILPLNNTSCTRVSGGTERSSYNACGVALHPFHVFGTHPYQAGSTEYKASRTPFSFHNYQTLYRSVLNVPRQVAVSRQGRSRFVVSRCPLCCRGVGLIQTCAFFFFFLLFNVCTWR